MPKLPWVSLILLGLAGTALARRSRDKSPATRHRVLPTRPRIEGVNAPAQTASFNYFVPSRETKSDRKNPGDPCPTAEGQIAVYDRNGDCLVFWVYEQDTPALRQIIRDVWNETGPPDMCDGAPSVLQYPGTYREQWAPNPQVSRIAKEALTRLYPTQPANIWPATPDGHSWVQSVWGIAVHAVGAEVCGWTVVT